MSLSYAAKTKIRQRLDRHFYGNGTACTAQTCPFNCNVCTGTLYKGKHLVLAIIALRYGHAGAIYK